MPDASTEKANRNGRWKHLFPFVVLLAATIAAGATMLSSGAIASAPVTTVRLVNSYPHDTTSFCQGLVVFKGALLEGTGQYNQSRLRLVDIQTGVPSVDIKLPGNVFGEGVTVYGNTILQLTWKNGYLITYDANSFQRTGKVPLKSMDRGFYEGWGITHDGKNLIISDGSSLLRFVNPQTWRVVRRLRVKDGRRSVSDLNELEFVNNQIFANIWYKDVIARIDPETGQIVEYLDIAPLRPASVKNNREAALNGIAWDPQAKRLFVTGKNWPNVFEVAF